MTNGNFGVIVVDMLKESSKNIIRDIIKFRNYKNKSIFLTCQRIVCTGVDPALDDVLKNNNRKITFAQLEDGFYESFTHNNRHSL